MTSAPLYHWGPGHKKLYTTDPSIGPNTALWDQPGISDRRFQQVAALTNLRALGLPGHQLRADSLIACLRALPRLEEVDLSCNEVNADVLRVLPQRSLRVLKLVNSDLTEEAMEAVSRFARFEVLNLDRNALPLRDLAFAAPLQQLRTLSLNVCGLRCWPGAWLYNHPTLHTFEAGFSNFEVFERRPDGTRPSCFPPLQVVTLHQCSGVREILPQLVGFSLRELTLQEADLDGDDDGDQDALVAFAKAVPNLLDKIDLVGVDLRAEVIDALSLCTRHLDF